MAFTRPLTLEQKQHAAAVYASLRANLRTLKENYPPRDSIERSALREYRDAIKAFGLEAAKPLSRVSVRELNRLDHATQVAMYTYMLCYELPRG